MIKDVSELPSVKRYLNRVGAEVRSLFTAVVSEKQGNYFKDIAIIRFNKVGTVYAPKAYYPTASESEAIRTEMVEAKFPNQIKATGLVNLPEVIKNAKPENLFIFRDEYDSILMLQLRIDRKTGEKNYVPYTYFDDGVWRAVEPEGNLPLYNIDKIKDNATVFIHEGAKAARAMQEMIEAKTLPMREKLANHPWCHELKNSVHVGWIGGALSPERTDWSVLKRLGITRAYIVSDNDIPGLQAVPKISFKLRMPTFHVQFTDEWPVSFDLADDFPKKMFKQIDGIDYYTGPDFRSCLHPATWATDKYEDDEGKRILLRDHFKEMWYYIDECDLWVCSEMPDITRSEGILNKMLSSFSHSKTTCELLLKSYQGRSASLCYRPDTVERVVTNRSRTSINLHIPPRIKPVAGDATLFLEYMEYMFPNPNECKNVLRWVATLIARPEVRMEYALLLVSESQGIGKTTLGNILAKLVGDYNVGFPSEKTITQSEFTSWIANKRLVICNEIYCGSSWKAYNTLKSYITDKDVYMNEKFQRPYTIDNWAHIIAMSNSMKALRMEQDDRRWFYPEITECRWEREKFTKLNNWLASGGLSIIFHWAQNFGDYVQVGERAPMTERKKDMIRESRSEAQQEVNALAEECMRISEPIYITMKAINTFAQNAIQGKMFDSDYELRKAMSEAGMKTTKTRIHIQKRLQHVVMNAEGYKRIVGLEGKQALDIVKMYLKSPDDIFGQAM